MGLSQLICCTEAIFMHNPNAVDGTPLWYHNEMTNTITCTDVNGNTYDIPLSDLQWRPSAYGIVIKDGCVLLSRQFGRYDLPGGGIDLGEEPTAAVIREIKEETGIDAAAPRILGVENSFFHAAHSNMQSFQTIMLYYACDFIGGELSTDGFDEDEKGYAELAEWVPLSSLNDIGVASTVDYRSYIRQAAEQMT